MTQGRAHGEPSGRTIYRGWLVIGGGFVSLLFAGIVHTSFGFFIVPVSTELHLSRADVNTWLVMMSVGSALLAPIAGWLIDRFSVRLVMTLGALAMAASFIAMSQSSSPLVLLLLALPVAFASDCAGGIATSTLAARWFRRRRGRAIMLVAIGSTASGVVLAPPVAYLVATQGWRGALPIMAVATGGVILLAVLLLIRARPTEQELIAAGEVLPDAAEAAGLVEAAHETYKWSHRELLGQRNFWLLSIAVGLLFASDRTMMASVAPYLDDNGLSLQQAGILVSVITGSSVCGKIVVGLFLDSIDPKRLFMVIVAMHVILMGAFAMQPGYWIVVAIAVFTGLGVGGVVPLSNYLTATIFGSTSFGTALGTAVVIHQVLMMIFLRGIGEIRDRTGSYDAGFMVFIACALTAALLASMLRLPRPETAARA